MTPIPPLPITHSWPLFERGLRFDLGLDFHWDRGAPIEGVVDGEALAQQGIGIWTCDLADSALSWTAGVYDLFGLPRDARPRRDETVALYCEPSRALMERLRAYAIRHHRGFTVDAEIQPVTGKRRWMRLSAAPICERGRVVRLCGVKRDVTAEYS